MKSNTRSKILGYLLFLFSSVWLLLVTVQPLLSFFEDLVQPEVELNLVKALSSIPGPPPPFTAFSIKSWWPVLLGVGGTIAGSAILFSVNKKTKKETKL